MNKEEIILTAVKKFETDDVAGVSQFLDDGLILSAAYVGELSKKEVLDLLADRKHAFSDYTLNLKIIGQVDDDQIKATIEPSGTHSGVLHYPGITPVQPTNVEFALPKHAIYITFKGDKISRIQVEDASAGGTKGLLMHLGIELPRDMRSEEDES